MTTRARTLTHRIGARLEREEHVLEAIVVIVSTIAFGIGLSMLWKPALYGATSFRVAFDWMPVHAWGGLLLSAGCMTFVALRGDRLTRFATLAWQTILWGILSIALIVAVAVEDGVPSGAIVYQGLAWICLLLAAYYRRTQNRGRLHAA